MNKVILMGRLTKDPEVRYTQTAEPLAVAKYALAVNRRFKRENEPDADFINCVAFRKDAEFAGKYFKKGMMVSVVGHLQVSTSDDQNGNKRWFTDVVIEEQHFAESKSSFEQRSGGAGDMSTSYNAPSYNAPSYNAPSASDRPAAAQPAQGSPAPAAPSGGFFSIDENIEDDDLPF